MLFHEFGAQDALPVLLMHGMMQDWRSFYELLKPLEAHYRLILPAMDGFYDHSPAFTSFADQARQIEEYVGEKHGGKLHGAYGVSQGGLMLTELLSRNRIAIKTVIMDGVYVAHQGRISGWCTYMMFRQYKNTGKFPALIHLTMKLMGTSVEKMMGDMEKSLYLGADDESLKRNFLENYTYRASPEIAKTASFVHLWCGSREPYAIKSHNILKKYLKNYKEEIIDGLGHGEFLLKDPAGLCGKIVDTLGPA